MHTKLALRLVGSASVLAPLALIVAPVRAQTPSANPQAVSVLETITVTAERRSESLQRTSISASVLTGEDLAKKNINTIDGLQFSTPSLTIQNTGQNVLVNIRGVGKSFGGIQDPSGVLIYRDGVSAAPGGFVADEPYYDLAGVEVLRGPQGTIAGQNATGGALFIRSIDPTLDAVKGNVQIQYGNYNDVLLRGAINIPLSDTFAVRVATNDQLRDSFYDVGGSWTGNAGERKEADGRVSFLWAPSDAWKIVWKNDFMYIDHGGSPAGPVANGTSHLFDLTSDAHLRGVERGARSVLQIGYEFENGVALRSIAGYQWYRTEYALDFDGTDSVFPAGRGPLIYEVRGTDRTVSEELNLLSPDAGPFKWLLGAVYQDEHVRIPPGGFVQSAAPGGTRTTGLATSVGYETPIESWGVFGQGTYDLNDLFQVQLGSRYSQSHMSLSDELQVLLGGVPILRHPIVDQRESDSRLTGKLGLNVHLTPASLIYAFVATGHKSGGINPLASTAAPAGTPAPAFEPEEVTDYELGWKHSFFGDQLRTQLNGFYENYEDYQVGIFDTSTGLTQLRNVPGKSNVKGVEAQAQAVFGNLSLDASVAYLDTELGTLAAIDSRNPARGVQDLTGRQLPEAAHWTASAGVQYTFRFAGDAALVPRIDYGMTSARWASVFAVDPIDRLAGRDLFNAQLTYDNAGDWEITAYATNLFDKQYISSLSLGSLAQAGPPRQYGVRLQKSF